MIDPVFARNPKEAERLSHKHLAIVGCGSGGSALAAMAARSGIGRFTLVDPDALALENLGRHMLSRADVGKPKAQGLKGMIEEVNPRAEVEAIGGSQLLLVDGIDFSYLLVEEVAGSGCESIGAFEFILRPADRSLDAIRAAAVGIDVQL